MNVLSLFDGISCGRIALERAGIIVDKYYASEIDKYAIQITQKNHLGTIQIGNVLDVKGSRYKGVDLLIGGSPCQGFSFAGKQLNFIDPRSRLFFEYVRVLEEVNPRYFLLENVKMKQEYQDIITRYLGVKPIEINSALVSAQSRRRLYWTNIPDITQPEDKGILLRDIVLSDVDPVALHSNGGFSQEVRTYITKSPTLTTSTGGRHIPFLVKKDLQLNEKAIEYMNRQVKDGRTHWDFKHYSDIRNDKSATVVANFFKGVPYNVFKDWDCIRKFHPVECERLQTLPDNYTEGISNTQRYKSIGNGWTVDVIAHILTSLEARSNKTACYVV